MTGMRHVRRTLKAMREDLGGDRIVTMEAGANLDEMMVGAFLDRELAGGRECLVVHLRRFEDAQRAPSIIRDQYGAGQ